MGKANDFRSQFKPKPITALRKQADTEDAAIGSLNNEYLNLEDGKTLKIRIFPAHPGNENFYAARKRYWLTVQGDNGPRRVTVPDSVFHAKTEMDVIAEYIKFAKARLTDAGGKENMAKIAALTATGPKVESLAAQYLWCAYAGIVPDADSDDLCRPKLWEFGKSVRDQLNRLAFQEDGDDTIEVDPFTDPDEGLYILAKYLKNPNKKKGEEYYTITFPRTPKAYVLTDEELEYFATLTPLDEMVSGYGVREFERAVEGLQYWDEEQGIDLFSDDEWLEHMEAIRAQYDGTEDAEEEEPKPAKRKSAPKKQAEPEEEPGESGDEYDAMDRAELKKFVKDHGIDFVTYKSTTEDEIRDAIRAAMGAEEPELEEPEPEEEPEEEPEPAPVKKPASKGAMTPEAIRAKLRGGK